MWHLRMSQIDEIGKEGKVSAPLNQEDLLATLGTFTTVVFSALQKLAVPYDEQDRKGLSSPLERRWVASGHRRPKALRARHYRDKGSGGQGTRSCLSR